MSITDIFSLLCGVSLFLFGMNLLGDGLKKVAGKKLEIILYKLSSTPLKGILLGTGVTAVIQSSSATSVMVVGFVNSGMMKVKQAIGVIMGAIIGTSVTGWIICLSGVNGSGIFEILSTDTITALTAVAGVILLMFTKKEQNHRFAYIFLGFAVLMCGISTMTGAVYGLRENESFIKLLTGFDNPLIGILTGMIFTCIIQSASAATGILQTLAITGAVSFRLALPVIMGIAIGASVPVLLSALGANTNGKRTSLIYLLVDTLGALIFGVIFYGANAVFRFEFTDNTMNMVSIALLNTVFRITVVLFLTPFISLLEKLVNSFIREKNEDVLGLRDVQRLEERFLNHPAIAIEQTRIAVNSMAQLSCDSILQSLDLLKNYRENDFKHICELEEIIDTYEDKLGAYTVKIMKNETDDEQSKMLNMFLHSVYDFERMGDHAKNIAESAKEMKEKNIVFSSGAEKEIAILSEVITEIITATKEAFINDDVNSSYKIEPLEQITDNLCDEYKINHIKRIENGLCEYSRGFVFNDILTDLERVSDHCSNLGIALRIRHGEMNGKHGALSKAEIKKSHNFETLYNEYLDRYKY